MPHSRAGQASGGGHVALVALSGFRAREAEMLELGMTLPGLHDRAQALAALPSLGVLTLAGMTPPGWTVSYRDPARVDDALVASLVAERPTIVGVSALTASIEEAYSFCDSLRREGVRTVIGGLHATACPDEAARHADAVVIGDGESTWHDVLADAAAGDLRRVYRPSQAFDLARAPLPRFVLLGDRERPRFTVQTARGCPLACDFCGASRLLGPYREKPVERIEAELDAVRAMRRRPIVELADDNSFLSRRSAPDLLGVLERSGVRYFTESDWRIGERPEVLERLAASGCVQVLVGMESFAPGYAGMGAKAAPRQRVMDAAARIQEAGVAVIGCFIVGGDGEDHESIQALIDFAIDAPLADVQLTLRTPFPGTALHRRLASQGRLLPDRGWSAYTLFDTTFVPDRLSVEQLDQGFHHAVRCVFAEGPAARRAAIRHEIWERRCRMT
ncbi:MAG: radical SAM protein [Phycisphaerales bacterium]